MIIDVKMECDKCKKNESVKELYVAETYLLNQILSLMYLCNKCISIQ